MQTWAAPAESPMTLEQRIAVKLLGWWNFSKTIPRKVDLHNAWQEASHLEMLFHSSLVACFSTL